LFNNECQTVCQVFQNSLSCWRNEMFGEGNEHVGL